MTTVALWHQQVIFCPAAQLAERLSLYEMGFLPLREQVFAAILPQLSISRLHLPHRCSPREPLPDE